MKRSLSVSYNAEGLIEKYVGSRFDAILKIAGNLEGILQTEQVMELSIGTLFYQFEAIGGQTIYTGTDQTGRTMLIPGAGAVAKPIVYVDRELVSPSLYTVSPDGTTVTFSSGHLLGSPVWIATFAYNEDGSMYFADNMQQDAVLQVLADASAAKDAAETAEVDAQTAQAAAEAAQAASETAQTAAELAQAASEAGQLGAEAAVAQIGSDADDADASAIAAAASAASALQAEIDAAASETNTAASETNAAASEGAAQTAQTAAELAETNAEIAQAAAEVAETNALASEVAAQSSEDDAAISQTNAGAAATNASNSEIAAAASETQTGLDRVATNADVVTTNADVLLAAASVAAAGASETAAGLSEIAAAASESASAASESASAASEAAADLSETNAAASEAAAGLSETASAGSEAAALASQSAAAISAAAALVSEGNAAASETAAGISEANAGSSETASGLSETASGLSETAAALSETNAAASETAAGLSETAAGLSETNAAASETAAGLSETAAGLSETAAALSETNAASSETAAGISETAAALSEANASSSETAAGLSQTATGIAQVAAELAETNAEAAEVAAELAETNAFNSQTASAASAAAALISEGNAATSETAAGLSETAAGSSETQTGLDAIATAADVVTTNADVVLVDASEAAALASELAAAISAAAALVSEGNASDSEAAAATSLGNIGTSETNSANSAAAALASEDAAAITLDNFEDRYLGVKSADPTLDNDGDPLVAGTLYFRSPTNPGFYVYTGTVWIAGETGPQGPAGDGVLPGGILGQTLTKLSSTDLDVDWAGPYTLLSAFTGHGHAISDVTSLQTTLDGKALSSHAHIIGDTTGLQTALDGKTDTGHAHIVGDVTGLQGALDAKSDDGHGHVIADTTGLQGALDGKSDTGHGHIIGDTTGLQTALDDKADAADLSLYSTLAGPNTFTGLTTFDEPITDVIKLEGIGPTFQLNETDHTSGSRCTNISMVAGNLILFSQQDDYGALIAPLGQMDRDGGVSATYSFVLRAAGDIRYAPFSHTHTISNTTGLQTALDGKALSSHTHPQSDVTDLVADLAGKAAVGHGHVIGDTTGLQTALDDKANRASSGYVYIFVDGTLGVANPADPEGNNDPFDTIANALLYVETTYSGVGMLELEVAAGTYNHVGDLEPHSNTQYLTIYGAGIGTTILNFDRCNSSNTQYFQFYNMTINSGLTGLAVAGNSNGGNIYIDTVTWNTTGRFFIGGSPDPYWGLPGSCIQNSTIIATWDSALTRPLIALAGNIQFIGNVNISITNSVTNNGTNGDDILSVENGSVSALDNATINIQDELASTPIAGTIDLKYGAKYAEGTGVTITNGTFLKTDASGVVQGDIKAVYEANADTNAFTDAEQTKLTGIDDGANLYNHPSDGVDPGAALTGADVYSDITVNAAGHVTGSAVRALTADDVSALALIGGTMTGDLIMSACDFAIEDAIPIIKFKETDQVEASQGSYITTTDGSVTIGTYTGPGYTGASSLARFDRGGGLTQTKSVVSRSNGDLRYAQLGAANTFTENTTISGVLTNTAGVNSAGTRESASIRIESFKPTLLLKDNSTSATDFLIQGDAETLGVYLIPSANDDLTAGAIAARFDAGGTSAPASTTIITRQKGDARYALAGATSASLVVDYQEFLTSGTWTKPVSAASGDKVLVHVVGGGGAGGQSSFGGSGGGGGGGAFQRFDEVDDLPASVSLVVGAGGATAAANGGNTTFGSSGTFEYLIGYGGTGGPNVGNTAGANGGQVEGRANGTVPAADLGQGGGDGGAGNATSGTGKSSIAGGGGGGGSTNNSSDAGGGPSMYAGGGGMGGGTGSTAAALRNGMFPGGGGGGRDTDYTASSPAGAGTGGDGVVRVWVIRE